MTIEQSVKARIEEQVAALDKRMQEAADLSELVKRNQLPQVTPAGFVLPLGLRPGEASAATGIFRQALRRVVGVLLVVRSAGDATGARSLPTIDELVEQVIAAVCGWAPADEIGVFELARGQLVSLTNGTVIYQLDFAIEDQLRVTS